MIPELLTAVRTFYVSPAGNDASLDPTNKSTPLATIQAAIGLIRLLHLGNYGAIIQLANGTYTVGAKVWNAWTGGNALNTPSGKGSPVTLRGDPLAPWNVVIAVTNDQCINVSMGGSLNLEGLRLTVASSGEAVYSSAFGQVWLTQANDFGPSAGDQMVANQQGKIVIAYNYYITGGGVSHLRASGLGCIEDNGIAAFLSSTPNFSEAFACATTLGLTSARGNSYNGSATGKTFAVSLGGGADSQGAGFPGNIAGTQITGGWAT